MITDDLVKFFYPGLHQLHVKQTKLTRVEYPYKPNCTKQNLSPNPFSTRYSQRTCLMSCLLKRWIYQCGDVPDTYRDYNSNGIRPYLSTSYEDRWNCLAQVLVNTNVGNCGCQLACEETQYKTREQTFKRWKNISSWNINVFNEETKEIVQVPDYPLADCLGAIGGIMGLAIGASSLSFVELIIYFIMNFRRKAYWVSNLNIVEANTNNIMSWMKQFVLYGPFSFDPSAALRGTLPKWFFFSIFLI